MSNKTKAKSQLVVMQQVPVYQPIVKKQRWLWLGVFALMTLVFIAGLILSPHRELPTTTASTQKMNAIDVSAVEMNPVLSAEVNKLKGQMVGLVSGSIESKLNNLEQSIRSGRMSSSLSTINELKGDITMLRSSYHEQFTTPNPALAQATQMNQQLQNEMSSLKKLVYLTLASCGLMLAAMAGVWLKNVKQLPYKEKLMRYQINTKI